MYKEPWYNIGDYPADQKTDLLCELAKEINCGHPLFGLEVNVLAKREDRDDILLESNNEYYIVHLTWSGKAESGNFPLTKYFSTKQALRKQLTEDSEFF